MTEFFTALTAAAWLVPNHYVPWLSAWSDAVAIVGLLGLLTFAALAAGAAGRISWRLPAVTALCWAVLLGQLATGKILYAGDALMAALYLGLWIAAVLAGGWMAVASGGRNDPLNALAAAWLFAAIVSVGIGLVQWTGAINLGIYGADLPPGARPFANVGQPNNFCTLSFLGLCGLLWLRQQQRVRGAAFWLAAGFLLWGMAMSQSRTGWLQIGLLVLWGLALHARAGLRIARAQLLGLGALFAAEVLLWPVACRVLLLPLGRAVGEEMKAGVRLPYWRAMLDAITREPLWGYGWQQVGAAQERVALDHPAFGVLFDHSHNLLLDLLLWNGIPLGGLIAALLAWWFVAHIRACRDARAAWLLAAVGGVMVHAMLEYPLDYAYFLIPVGLAMGAVEVFAPVRARMLTVPRWGALGLALLLGVVSLGVGSDYVKAEANDRLQRFELAHIGARGVETPVPRLRLLTQLEAFLQIAHTDPVPGMTPAQLDWLRKAALRWGYPSTLGRYALALALNGHPKEAARELQVLRHIWGEAAYAWAKAQFKALAAGKYPQLRAVSLP